MRPISSSDLEIFYESVHASLPELKPWMSWLEGDFSKQKALLFLEKAYEHQCENTALQLGVFNESRFVGMLSLNMIDWQNKTTEIGYWAKTQETKKGFISEGIEVLIQFAHTKLGLENFFIRCSAKNPDSQRIATKLGFQQMYKLPGILSFPKDHLGILYSKKHQGI